MISSQYIFEQVRQLLPDVSLGAVREHVGQALSLVGVRPALKVVVEVLPVRKHRASTKLTVQDALLLVKVEGEDGICWCDQLTGLQCYFDARTDQVVEVGSCGQPVMQCKSMLWIKDDGSGVDVEMRVLRKATSPLVRLVHCEDDPGIGQLLDETDIDGQKLRQERWWLEDDTTVATSFEKGLVIFVYTAADPDSIPENADLIEALTSFVLYKEFERQFLLSPTRENQARLQLKRSDWELAAARARSSLRMPDLPDLENIRQHLLASLLSGSRFSSDYGLRNSLDINNSNVKY